MRFLCAKLANKCHFTKGISKCKCISALAQIFIDLDEDQMMRFAEASLSFIFQLWNEVQIPAGLSNLKISVIVSCEQHWL